MNGMETYLSGSPLMAVAAVFAAGILAGLSPCDLPALFSGAAEHVEVKASRQ